jgi:RNA polymerase sigma-70 factor (ECF subfamily)
MMLTGPASGPPTSLPLESLMSGYQQANEEAARALIHQVSPLLLRFFWVQAPQRRFAEDLLQETWMRVHKARHTYRRGEPVLPWIFAIARHTGLDQYRKTRRVESRETQVEVLPDTADPRSGSAQDAAHPSREGERLSQITAMLRDLPSSQREVILMLKVSGMSIEEVARATSSTTGSVKQKAHRAYSKLREVLVYKGVNKGRSQ